MVYCCVPYCKSDSGKSKGISFHDFPSNLLLRAKWLIAVARKDFTPNCNSYSSAVCSLHFKDTDYKPGLRRRVLKPNSVPSVFPNYPPYLKTRKFAPARRIPERKELKTSLKKVSLKNPIQLQPPQESSANFNLESGSVSEAECFEAPTVPEVKSQFSQTTWDVDDSICKLKQDNSSLSSEISQLNKKLKQLQSRLDKSLQLLNVFESDEAHLCLEKVIKAADENDDQAISLLEQILNFGRREKQK